MRKVIALFIVLIALFSNVAPAFACEPPPPSSNVIDCTDLGKGYQFGFRVSGAREGKYYFTSQYGSLIGGAPSDRVNYVQISDSDYRTFDWNTSLGVDAVIILAEGKTKVRKVTEDTSGNNFHGETNRYGRPYRIDKIYFCYDYELSVKAKAEGTVTGGPAAWDITKSVASAEKAAFAGEKVNFDYTVAVQKTAGGDSGYSVKAEVKVKNNSPMKAKLKAGRVVLNPGNIDITDSLKCEGANLSTKYLYPWQEITCTATKALPSRLDGTVSAVVYTYIYYGNSVGGDSDTEEITWNEEPQAGPAEGGFNTVTVTDTNPAFGGPFTVSDNQSWTYPVELTCPTDPAAYTDGVMTTKLDNTAAITETSQSASQSVTLTCYAPTVTTGANATYDVQYTWGILKTSPLTVLELEENESANVDYTATVSIASTTQTNIKLAGSVTIGNPNPDAPMEVSLTDEMAPGVPAPLTNCASPLTIPAGESVTCSFETPAEALPQSSNNVQVVFNGITFAATAPFATAVNEEIDECVTVTDTAFEEPLGVVCAPQSPAVFPYSVEIGPYDRCQETSYVNTADFVTNDTAATDFSTWELYIDVHCPVQTDCVRTIQYWMNRSNPADPTMYNPTWDLVPPSGPSTPFYTTGSSWAQILSSNAGNNAYLRLAQAYIAAKLNTLWGAMANETVSASMSQADSLLSQYASSQNLVTGTVALEFRDATTVLSNFNRGVYGSPICVDCDE